VINSQLSITIDFLLLATKNDKQLINMNKFIALFAIFLVIATAYAAENAAPNPDLKPAEQYYSGYYGGHYPSYAGYGYGGYAYPGYGAYAYYRR
jgi:hypothetical protein